MCLTLRATHGGLVDVKVPLWGVVAAAVALTRNVSETLVSVVPVALMGKLWPALPTQDDGFLETHQIGNMRASGLPYCPAPILQRQSPHYLPFAFSIRAARRASFRSAGSLTPLKCPCSIRFFAYAN